ncbi:unnamed protein product [Leptosia nina]|uniref:Uncharacterized protein n=1 Tax=Leptosia nina TaxID=320188 RepID=A0AAV1J5Q9_9NEOP
MHYIYLTSVYSVFVIITAAQYQLPGQYAFPQMPGAGMGQLSPQMLQMPSGAISMAPNPSMALNSPFQIPQPRLPVMVMPYHSKASDKKYKKRKRIKNKHKESSSSSSSDSHSSSKEYVMRSKKKHRKKQKRQVLTPVISYVTRNGDIVYQKKVKKEKAGDWLELGKRPTSMAAESGEDIFDTKEITIRDLKQKFDFKKKQRKRTH